MADATPCKPCCRCGLTKPLTEFHNSKGRPDGKNSACKACICAERRQYTKDNPEKLAAYRKRKRAEDPEKERARSRAWYQANRERAAEYHRAWVAANQEMRATQKRAWYDANREWVLSWPERNPEGERAKHRRYREAHREARAEAQRRRRVDSLGGTVDDVDLDALWTGLCGLCGESMDRAVRWPDPLSPSVDHILPLSRGGTHVATNLQWAHLTCNVRKGNRVSTEDEGEVA